MLTRRESSAHLGAIFLCPAGASRGWAQLVSKVHHIDIDNFSFEPQMLAISVGETVTWHNHDLAPHTTTAEDGTCDSDVLAYDASFNLTFHQAGQHSYFCAFHPHMKGMVVVTES